jgi:succinate dehydrogenase flavin-adding protein (antitoxin of CptAB toxin-antitoxin module)
MAINVTVSSIVSGTSPYNVWVCDSCGVGGTSQYIDTFSTSAYTFTLPTIYESYTTYYVKVIDANGCSYCVSPDLVGCNIFVGYWDGNSYYKYNVISDTSEGPLSLVITPSGDNSPMANTEDKMWFLSSTGVTELDITIDPFSNTYNREIAINLDDNKEIFAIDNNNLLVLATNTGTSTTHIYNAVITGTTASTTNLLEIVGSLSGSPGIRDMKLSTENKVIVIGTNTGSTYLQQYDYVSGGTLEVEINLSGITNVGSFVESNDQFYILNNSNEVYQINLTAPYLITFEKTSTTPIGFGRTSQRYGCITQKFT